MPDELTLVSRNQGSLRSSASTGRVEEEVTRGGGAIAQGDVEDGRGEVLGDIACRWPSSSCSDCFEGYEASSKVFRAHLDDTGKSEGNWGKRSGAQYQLYIRLRGRTERYQ
jgi:hypothetical protein